MSNSDTRGVLRHLLMNNTTSIRLLWSLILQTLLGGTRPRRVYPRKIIHLVMISTLVGNALPTTIFQHTHPIALTMPTRDIPNRVSLFLHR